MMERGVRANGSSRRRRPSRRRPYGSGARRPGGEVSNLTAYGAQLLKFANDGSFMEEFLKQQQREQEQKRNQDAAMRKQEQQEEEYEEEEEEEEEEKMRMCTKAGEQGAAAQQHQRQQRSGAGREMKGEEGRGVGIDNRPSSGRSGDVQKGRLGGGGSGALSFRAGEVEQTSLRKGAGGGEGGGGSDDLTPSVDVGNTRQSTGNGGASGGGGSGSATGLPGAASTAKTVVVPKAGTGFILAKNRPIMPIEPKKVQWRSGNGESGPDAKRAKMDSDRAAPPKPSSYLQEMRRYQEKACGAESSYTRPLLK